MSSKLGGDNGGIASNWLFPPISSRILRVVDGCSVSSFLGNSVPASILLTMSEEPLLLLLLDEAACADEITEAKTPDSLSP